MVKDAKAIGVTFARPDLCAYPIYHVRLLRNEDATRRAILNGLKWLEDPAPAAHGATSVVGFSGHGWLKQDRYCRIT